MPNVVEIEITTVYKPGQGLANAETKIRADAQRIAADIEQQFAKAADGAEKELRSIGDRASRAFADVRPPANFEAKIVEPFKQAGDKAGAELAGGVEGGFGGINFGAIGSQLSAGLSGLLSAGAGVLAVAGSLGLAFGDDFMAGFSTGMNSNRASAVRAIKSGLPTDVVRSLGAEAGDLYSRGFGESLSGMKDIAAAVEQNLRGIDDGLDTTQITRYASTFEEVFGVAIPEQTRLARRLIANELAPDTEAAYDLMIGASQRFGDEMDEGLDILREYAPTFRSLGIDGASAVDLVGSAIENGWFNVLDRAGDMWLELRNRIVASDDAKDAVEDLGLSFRDLRDDMAQGGEIGEQALQRLIGALLEIENDADLATAAVEIFGVNMEEVADPRFAFEMMNQSLALETVAGSAEDAAVAVEGAATEWDTLSRRITTTGAEAGQTASNLLNVLIDIADWSPGSDAEDQLTVLEGRLSTTKIEGGELADVIRGVLNPAFADVADEFNATSRSLFETGSAMKTTESAADDLEQEMKDLEAAARATLDQLNSWSDNSAERAMIDMNNAVDDLSDAFDKDAIAAFALAGQWDLTTEAGQQSALAADAYRDRIAALTAAHLESETGVPGYTAAMARLKQEFIEGRIEAGGEEAAVRALADSIFDFPPDLERTISVHTATALGNIAAAAGAMIGFPASISRSINVFRNNVTTNTTTNRVVNRGPNNREAGGNVGYAAGGIPSAAGGGMGIETLVNDGAGIESVRLPQGDVVPLAAGSTVFTAEDTERMFTGGGGGRSLTVHVHGSVFAERDIQAVVRDAVYRGDFDGLGGVN